MEIDSGSSKKNFSGSNMIGLTYTVGTFGK